MCKTKSVVPLVLALVSGSVFVLWVGVSFYKAVSFEQDIGGHLKLAADANSVELAEQQLGIALTSLDTRQICDDPEFTSLLYRTPDEDVGYWCTNLRTTHDDLTDFLASDGDDLTESNMLIKVRETLLDHDNKGDTVTAPKGISVYPHNGPFAWWGVLSFIPMSFIPHYALRMHARWQA